MFLRWLCRTLLLVCPILFSVGADSAQAADSPCPRPPQISYPAQIQFRIFDPVVVFRHDVDLFGLPRVEGHMELPPAGWVLQGLTLTNEQLQLKLRFRKEILSDGRACIWLLQVDAVLGMPEQHVYVARDYPDGSCEYQAVLKHEYKHVAINRQVVHNFADRIQQALRDGVNKANPLLFSNGSVSDQQILAAIRATMTAPSEAMHTELRQQNSAIDTPAAYRKEHAESGCANWFPNGVPAYAHRRP